MPPKTSRDFLKVAEQRLNAAEVLFDADLTLDAQYVAGYAVECSLKAVILGRCSRGETRGFLRTCFEIYHWAKGEVQ